jgi:hypothetical protein
MRPHNEHAMIYQETGAKLTSVCCEESFMHAHKQCIPRQCGALLSCVRRYNLHLNPGIVGVSRPLSGLLAFAAELLTQLHHSGRPAILRCRCGSCCGTLLRSRSSRWGRAGRWHLAPMSCGARQERQRSAGWLADRASMVTWVSLLDWTVQAHYRSPPTTCR